MEPGEEYGEVPYNKEPGEEFGEVAYNRNPDPKADPEDSGSWWEDY